MKTYEPRKVSYGIHMSHLEKLCEQESPWAQNTEYGSFYTLAKVDLNWGGEKAILEVQNHKHFIFKAGFSMTDRPVNKII